MQSDEPMQSNERCTDLSKRENQVMEHIMMGMTNKRIARELFLTERTVKFHCSNIYRKLNIKNRASLVMLMSESVYHNTANKAA